jgi:hypothetical protein
MHLLSQVGLFTPSLDTSIDDEHVVSIQGRQLASSRTTDVDRPRPAHGGGWPVARPKISRVEIEFRPVRIVYII